MNVPNALTLSRFFLTAIMMSLLFAPIPFARTMALVVFVVAGITDALDGRLARNVYGVTAFGELLDPLADKVLVCAAFVSFVEIRIPGGGHPLVPAWIAVVIIAREFLVTGLRVLAGNKGQHIPAGIWGKHKTIWQIVAISTMLLGLAIEQDLLPRVAPGAIPRFDFYFAWTAYILAIVVALITVVSGTIYVHQHRDLIRDQT